MRKTGFQTASERQKPRAWLRHTPYLGGRNPLPAALCQTIRRVCGAATHAVWGFVGGTDFAMRQRTRASPWDDTLYLMAEAV